jgi:lipopolysaccharide biosynthesis glycosyltransferase
LPSPRWDFDVSQSVRANESYLRVLTVRPHLRKYLPGYDVYVWIDADVHVQHAVAVDWFVDAVRDGGMALVPQVHHSYRHSEQTVNCRAQRMFRYFGAASAQRTLREPYYNAGVFALSSDAPH